jgi:predicted CXXCH cytochrome family protein
MTATGRVLVGAALSVLALGVAKRAGPGQPAAGDRSNAFIGAQACAACHPQMHDTWSRGRHSRMLQPASAASVVGDFSRSSVTLHGRPFQLRAAGGQYFVTESYLNGQPQEHRVEFTLGSRRVQHYLTTVDKGLMIVLPPSWDVQRREWFDNMDIVGPKAADRTPVQQWNKDCVGCHVSGEEKNFRADRREYATRWTDFGTTCERCHGPGRAHAQLYAAPRPAGAVADRAIVRPTRLDPATSSMICAQCHSLRNVINPEYTAGADYYDFFNPRLEYDPGTDRELPYWPDGRPRRFSNDAIGLWQSACFLRGQATCTSCHRDPHEPNIERNPQLASTNNALCTQCHQAIGGAVTEHTRHAATSAGSSCVECHMPKTVISLNATMRDHTIGVPAPENTVAFGIPNACTSCHADRKASWAVDVLNAWWPGGRRLKLVERAQAFSGARRNSPAALDGLLAIAGDAAASPLIRATAVGYLRRYPGAQTRGALVAAADADHPAIRAAAVAGLADVATADDGSVRAVLVGALADPRRAVRIAALVSLVNGKGGPMDATADARIRLVGRDFAKLSALYDDDPRFDRDLGLVQLLGGDFTAAGKALETSLLLDPKQPSGSFLLALARLGQGRADDARTLLGRVPESDPSYAAARRQLEQLRR